MEINIPIKLDMTLQADFEFMEWYSQEGKKELAKDALLLGSFVLRSGLYKYSLTEEKDDDGKYALEIKSLNDILHHTVDTYELRLKAMASNKDTYYKEQIDVLTGRIENAKEATREAVTLEYNDRVAALESMCTRLKDALVEQVEEGRKGIRVEYEAKLSLMQISLDKLQAELDKHAKESHEVLCLKETVRARENEIALLKNNNIVKGNIGEGLVRGLIAKHYTSFELQDTSGAGAMSDIHVVNGKEDRIVVECKNKASITLSDVEKSIRDIEVLNDKYGDKFVGYLFVSIRSLNIPRKGEFHFEMIKGKPVVWFGMDVENCSTYERDFINVFKVLLSLCSMFKVGAGLDQDALMEKIQNYLMRVTEQKKILASMNAGMCTMKGQVERLSESVSIMYDELRTMITDDAVGEPAKGDAFLCSTCSLVCKSKAGLTKHTRMCNKN